MARNSGLAVKLGFGFGIVVVIAIALGMLGVFNMNSVKTTVLGLAKEEVPQVEVANNIERETQDMLFAMRGYVLSYEANYLEDGDKKLAEVMKYIKNAEKLGESSPRMAKLKDDAQKAMAAVKEYEKLKDDTANAINNIQGAIKLAVPLGAKIMDNANLFLDDQKQIFEKDANAGVEAAKLKDRFNKGMVAGEIISTFMDARKLIWQGLRTNNNDLLKQAMDGYKKVVSNVDYLLTVTTQPKHVQALNEIKSGAQEYIGVVDKIVQNSIILTDVNAKRGVAVNKVMEEARKMAQEAMKATDAQTKSAANQLSTSSVIMIVGLGIGVVIAILMASTITVSITKPINKIVDALNESSGQTAAAANQVSSAAQQLSQGATEQAAALEETSSSLDEMSSMTKQNADNASKANQLASEAKVAAEQGNEAMSQMSHAMGAINESSDKISKIIKTIEEIAFQTNLLALNAAVEAARAGEHGKGFAVVAEEVRNLARRSAESAKDTATLIEDSINKVKGGTEIAKKAGDSLKSIMEGNKKVADIVSEIAAASKEQAEGIGQVTNAVSQMDQVTQQNASAAEESASASEELTSQAESLRGMVHELQQVVGGAGVAMTTSIPARGAERRVSVEPRSQLKAKTAAPKISLAHHAAAKSSGAPKVVKPSDVIPMDDSESKLSQF